MAALLTAIGVTEIYRLGPSDALRQGLWIVIGVAVFGATLFWLHKDYRVLERYKYVFGVTAIGLLFLPALPGIGETINGSRLWVHVGSLQFQPGELGKIALIVFLAAYLREKREVLAQGRLKDWGPLLVIWGGAMLVLLATDDLGSALLYYGIFLAMLYVATARLSFVAAALGLFLVGAFGVTQMTPHVKERVDVWLDPYKHAQSSGYQILQSLYSIAHGGVGGTGLGRGIVTTQTGQQIVPDQNTDFIYSALAQELGLIGAAALLLLYMAFVLRGFRIALTATDGFSKLLAAGLSFSFAFQTFVIVGGITRVIPLTGITLPFVSYGGSSVVANFLLVAGLLLISNRANRQQEAVA
jgi:cell division protein FtsW (lipid II flippase)